MLRSFSVWLLGLACVLGGGGRALAYPQEKEKEQEPKKQDEAKPDAVSKADRAKSFALPGEDPPQPFVPLEPRTVEGRKQVEAATLFSVARALEERRAFTEAIDLLEQALKIEPDSVTILRRLTRDCLGIGRTEQGIKYGRRALTVAPGDTETISRLVNHYNNRMRDPAAAEALLKEVLANPKLESNDPSRTLAEFELGRLYASKLQQIDKAADSFAKVVQALDHKDANRLAPADIRRILGVDEASAYQDFGLVFLQAKRYDLAAKAFERGLDYEPDDPQLPLLLAQTLLKLNKGDAALAMVEHHLRRQPQGVEGYDLLAKVLTMLNRENEITPRLEQAAKTDSKNLALQYALADRYRETGKADEAEAMYKQLLTARPTMQGYAALASSLFKRKKAEELLKVMIEAVTQPGGGDAIKDQVQGIQNDPAFAEAVLDAGLKMAKDDRKSLGQPGTTILLIIARGSDKREKFLPIQRLALERNANPITYKEFCNFLFEMKKFDEAASTLEEMLKKFPLERNAANLYDLARFYRLADKPEQAVSTARESLKLEPNNVDVKVQTAIVLSQSGKSDEAVTLLREAAEKNPANAQISSILGNVLTTAGRNEEAIALFKSLLEKYPNDEDIVRTARSNLSVVYVNMGDYAKGEAELEALLERNPDEAGVNNDLGYLYADQGKNLEKAEAMIRKAVQDEPDNSAYLDSLGWVLFKRGKVKEAVEPLEKAVKAISDAASSDATIFEHLGDVYIQLRETVKAKDAWKSAEKAANRATPPDKRLPEIKKKLDALEKLNAIPKPATGDTP